MEVKMMLTYSTGSVFNANTQAIVNTVNCVGVMGAGIALECRLRYPDMFEDYKKKCLDRKIIVGKVDFFTSIDETIICNFPTKDHFKYPSKIEWIEEGLKNFRSTYSQYGIKSIAFPKLGTNNGELSWTDVKPLMEKYLNDLEIDVVICVDTDEYAQGKEKYMVDRINKSNVDDLSKIVKLNKKQATILSENFPIKRFRNLLEIESIGLTTYKKFFEHFFTDEVKKEFDQITLL